MSISMPTTQTPASLFQSQFGAPPGSQDLRADCERWERLCAELLAERERLRAELERARFDEFCRSALPKLTREELSCQVDRENSLDDIIAQLKEEARAEQ